MFGFDPKRTSTAVRQPTFAPGRDTNGRRIENSMTILGEIQRWSETLPTWQQHTIAILYERPELTPDELDDTLALLKVSCGIPNPVARQPRRLDAGRVAEPPTNTTLVQLVAIRNLRNVNALAEGKALPLSPEGLTVIYGDNGVAVAASVPGRGFVGYGAPSLVDAPGLEQRGR
jgi:hypothetical protein